MSPIHDQTYRHYEGARQPAGRAWMVIAWSGIRSVLAKRPFLALLLVSYIPFIVRAVQLYVVLNYPQVGRLTPVDASLFRQFLGQQGTFVFFVTVYVGMGLIANDRRANALQIYLSKPLLRSEYVVGKLAILMFFLLQITLVPSILLLLLQIGFSGSVEFLRNNLFLIPAIFLACLLESLVASLTMLALSSLSKSSRFVALMYTGALFFSGAVFGALTAITGSTRVAWVSLASNVEQVNDVIFRQHPTFETPWAVCLMVLLGLVAVSISVLERRVRGVEVVS